ncbi:OLC1v1033118C1 [Oldenlandia corymbosa var. corymbosa]|uniref:procollagen-proline 3-dioxygenase n=1 Tax=Oldenlandia corymbosa var. corymbosa TaxID=529605 RepID=A0AAV1CN79_OLDCO|nr:OLC1v1033118C1 [Oldenlandia corymbosa var. corymbosa]
MAAETEHPRLILHNFLSEDDCKELQFLHKSCCTVGYRPNVFSTTLSHLIATNSAHLLMPFVPIRERLKEKVEEYFNCQYELVVEFTGLISWTKGASIGWHSDDNRPYLKQRDFAVVCYLNSYEEDFRGGLFRFQDGEPSTIVPMAGDVLMYTADEKNIHAVDEITEGERITLTMWFSRDASHDEDAKLISFLSQNSLDKLERNFDSYLPVPASNNMYWFPPSEGLTFLSGFDIRCARLHTLGLDIYSPNDHMHYPAEKSSSNLLELLMGPLQLAHEDELFNKVFVNMMHVLQVVQFYCYKYPFSSNVINVKEVSTNVLPQSKAQQENINCLKLVFLKDLLQAETFIRNLNCGKKSQFNFDWASLSAALVEWEAYTAALGEKLLQSFPNWKAHGSIFDCSVSHLIESL